MRLEPKKMVQHQVYTSKFGVIYQGQKVVQVDPHLWGPMIDTILVVSFSGSNPDIWFKHEPEPFDTIRPSCVRQIGWYHGCDGDNVIEL